MHRPWHRVRGGLLSGYIHGLSDITASTQRAFLHYCRAALGFLPRAKVKGASQLSAYFAASLSLPRRALRTGCLDPESHPSCPENWDPFGNSSVRWSWELQGQGSNNNMSSFPTSEEWPR